MIRPQLILDINNELFVDNFAGGGGASTGIERALGRHVDHAINHDRFALGMHRINHPQTIHHCEDVFDVDPRMLAGGRPIGGAWFSPDCKHFSKAKGGKPLSKKIRGLAFIMLRYAKYRARVIYMENVEEIQTWGPLLTSGMPDPKHKGRTWQAFKDALGKGVDPHHPDLQEMLDVLGSSVTREELVRGFGYQVETKEIRACDHGSKTIRKRLFMIARCDGQPIVWPERTHAKNPTGNLKPWGTVAECIDWSVPCNSIFLTGAEAKAARCKRPLAKSSLRRIATGIDRYVMKAKKPFLISLTHQGGDRVEPIDQPANTITGAHRGEKGLVAPVLSKFHGDHAGRADGATRGQSVDEPLKTQDVSNRFALTEATLAPFVTEHANGTHQRNFPADEPMRTQCAEVKGGHFALVSAHLMVNTTGHPGAAAEDPVPTIPTGGHHALVAANLIKLRGDVETHGNAPGIDEPAHAISAGGTHHGVSVAYLAQHNNTTNVGHPVDEPISTISSKGSQQQVVSANLAAYYGSEKDGQAVNEPLRTISTKPRFCLSQSDAVAAPLTPEQIIMAHRVAAFLREYGVKFEGEFATVGGFVIVDIGMRMLLPRELFRAQGFADTYIIDKAWVVNPKTGEIDEVMLTKEQQIRMCGNSVCPDVAEALVAANSGDMAVWSKGERRRLSALSH